MVALQKIDDSMFDAIYEEFLVDDDPDLLREDWHRLFAAGIDTVSEYAGYALVEGSTIGGILGMLFSERQLDGQSHRFCSLHTWMVRPEYRGHSLRLMRPATQLKDHTICDFTPTAPVRALSRRLGFSDLDSSLRVLLPVGGAGSRRDDFGAGSRRDDFEILDNREQLRSQLSDADRQLLDDHAADHLSHVLFSAGTQQCYVICSRVTRWRLPYCHIHYVSDMSFFARHSLPIRKHIGRAAQTPVVVINERQATSVRLPCSFRFRFTNGQLWRPAQATTGQVDSLYSDVVYLNLTTIDRLSQIVREKLRLA